MSRRTKLVLSAAALAGSIALWVFLTPNVLMYWCFPRDHGSELSKERLAAWSKEFQTIGLAVPPDTSQWYGDIAFDGENGDWNFRVEKSAVRGWLRSSRAIRTARLDTKSERSAYMYCIPSVNRSCMVYYWDNEDPVDVRIFTHAIRKKGDTTPIDTRACEKEYKRWRSLLEDFDVTYKRHRPV